MGYELHKIELELGSSQLNEKFKIFHDEKIIQGHPLTSQVKGNYKETTLLIRQEAYHKLAKEYRKLFESELHRITTAINDHYIKYDKDTFSKYIIANYKGLMKIENHADEKKPEEFKYYDSDFWEEHEKYTLRQINYLLQSKFITPLINYIDNNHDQILLDNNIIESPIDQFLEAIKAHDVNLSFHKEDMGLYKPIFSDESQLYITATYNNHVVPSTYDEKLQYLYDRFKNNIKVNVSSDEIIQNKLLFLENIKSEINEIYELFRQITSDLSVNKESILYSRTDAVQLIREELYEQHHKKGYKDKNLYRLISVQFKYIDYAYKYIFSSIRTIKKSLMSKEIQSPENSLSQKNPGKKNQPLNTDKLQWKGQINILVRIFYELSNDFIVDGKPILNASKDQITNLLYNNFLNKNGDELSKATILTGLNPARHDKRAPDHKKYNIPPPTE